MPKAKSFENAYKALKDSANKIEDPNVKLDDAIKAFEAGLSHYDTCLKILDEAELKVKNVMDKATNAE